MFNILNNYKQTINNQINSLLLLDPYNILDKGYAIVYHDNRIIKDFHMLKNDDTINIVNKQATITASIQKVVQNGK
jgi:exonuclease VII large subunit